jgi:hypothetical protein
MAEQGSKIIMLGASALHSACGSLLDRAALRNTTFYEGYSESKYRFAVKKSSKVSYNILLISDSTFFRLFFHIFAAIIEALMEYNSLFVLR